MPKRTPRPSNMLLDQMLAGLQLKRLTAGWFILDTTEKHTDRFGPYDTKAEAESDRKGIARTYADMASGKPRVGS